MNRCYPILCTLLAAVCGCASAVTPAEAGGTLASQDSLTQPAPGGASQQSSAVLGHTSTSEAVATVYGKPITVEQLLRPMTEAHGLVFLLHLAQIELCRQKADVAKVSVTAEDIAAERQRTLEQMFKDVIPPDSKMTPEEEAAFRQKEYDRLLAQYLTTTRFSAAEFDLTIQTNTYLRKLAESEPGLKEKITEQHVRDGFGILFGEKVKVRHIQVANPREMAEVLRRLREGEPFEKVAAEMSIDTPSRAAGGEIRPFSRADTTVPQAFKDAAFALKEPGDLSEQIQSGNSYHIIKLIAKIPPNLAVKYETHKDYVREELTKGLILVRIRELRESLAVEARSALRINDPVLRKQYLQRLEAAAGESQADPNAVRKQILLDRPRSQAASKPGAEESEGLRPPATMPGQ